jgi:hypothetical protein
VLHLSSILAPRDLILQDTSTVQENHCKSSDFPLQRRHKECRPRERLFFCITAILVDLLKYEVDLSPRQEMACFMCILREIHEERIADNSDDTCEKTFNHEDPLPGLKTTQSAHLRDAVGEDAREG